MVFGVQKVVIVQESYTIWQKSMFVYSLSYIEYKGLQKSNGVDRWGKCVTWIATELSYRHVTHASLTHKCIFGLERVQVRLDLHIFNTNNSAYYSCWDAYSLLKHYTCESYFVTLN
jgi:hypothetical protein